MHRSFFAASLAGLLLAGAVACVPTRDMPSLPCSSDNDCPAGGHFTCNTSIGKCEACDACTSPDVVKTDLGSTEDVIASTDAIVTDAPGSDVGAVDAATDVSAADTGVTAPAGMAFVPGGTFWMGCNLAKDPSCNTDENPQHKVTLSSYFIDLNEATVAQYKACVDAGACSAPASVQPVQYATYPGLANNPVNFLTWIQARSYCTWRGNGYDLPTEAQWEMAARGSCEKNNSSAGDDSCKTAMRTYPWGAAVADCGTAVMAGCGGTTAGVGTLAAGDSPYGLHDMAGNVWEWTRDWYAAYTGAAEVDPVGAGSGTDRVGRGGSFLYGAASQRAGIRNHGFPTDSASDLGVRCIKAYP